MIEIEVRYFATLRKDNKKKEVLILEDELTTGELIDDLQIPREEIAILLVNGIKSGFDVSIKDKDIISLFPPVGGG